MNINNPNNEHIYPNNDGQYSNSSLYPPYQPIYPTQQTQQNQQQTMFHSIPNNISPNIRHTTPSPTYSQDISPPNQHPHQYNNNNNMSYMPSQMGIYGSDIYQNQMLYHNFNAFEQIHHHQIQYQQPQQHQPYPQYPPQQYPQQQYPQQQYPQQQLGDNNELIENKKKKKKNKKKKKKDKKKEKKIKLKTNSNDDDDDKNNLKKKKEIQELLKWKNEFDKKYNNDNKLINNKISHNDDVNINKVENNLNNNDKDIFNIDGDISDNDDDDDDDDDDDILEGEVIDVDDNDIFNTNDDEINQKIHDITPVNSHIPFSFEDKDIEKSDHQNNNNNNNNNNNFITPTKLSPPLNININKVSPDNNSNNQYYNNFQYNSPKSADQNLNYLSLRKVSKRRFTRPQSAPMYVLESTQRKKNDKKSRKITLSPEIREMMKKSSDISKTKKDNDDNKNNKNTRPRTASDIYEKTTLAEARRESLQGNNNNKKKNSRKNGKPPRPNSAQTYKQRHQNGTKLKIQTDSNNKRVVLSFLKNKINNLIIFFPIYFV